MNKNPFPVSVTIFGKEYKIVCSEEERTELIEAARKLDRQMTEIRDSGKVVGAERIAVMAALNLSHELNQQKKITRVFDSGINNHLSQLRRKIEAALEKSH